MKSGTTPAPRTKIKTRTRWIMLTLAAVLVPLAFIAQSGSAQKGRLREEKREAAERREKEAAAELRRKTEQMAAPGSDEEKLRLAAAARPKAFRQSGLSPEPLSVKADAFAVSRPLAEVARNQTKAVLTEEDREHMEKEAAENRPTRVVSEQAKAEADRAVERGEIRDTALQSNIPQRNMPSPLVSFEGLGRAENIAAGFGSLSQIGRAHV